MSITLMIHIGNYSLHFYKCRETYQWIPKYVSFRNYIEITWLKYVLAVSNYEE